MTLKEHLAIIDDPVVLEIREDDNVLYHGYRGCFSYAGAAHLEQMQVTRFRMRVDGKRRTNEADKHTITELNAGTFNYCDMHIELVYVYEVKK